MSTLTPDQPKKVSNTDRPHGMQGRGALIEKSSGVTIDGLGAEAGGEGEGEGKEEGEGEGEGEGRRAAQRSEAEAAEEEEVMLRLEEGTHGEQLVAFLMRLKGGQRSK